MVPSTRQRRTKARSGQLLSISVLAGVLVIALGTVTVVSVYLSRVSSTVESMAKASPLGGYEGRPEKVVAEGAVAAPIDYLVLVAGEDDDLLSVHLVNLSGSRRDLTLIGLPSDLLVSSGPRQPHRTLAELYREGADEVAKQVELLLGVRTDHQVRLGMEGFSGVVDALGGLDGVAAAEPATGGRELLRYVASAADGPGRVERVSEIVRGTMVRLGMMHAVANPYQFDSVLKALEHCTLIDSNLTVAEFEATLMESSVRSEEIGTYLLPSSPAGGGRVAVPGDLAGLRSALADDTVAALAEPIVPASPAAAPATASPSARR